MDLSKQVVSLEQAERLRELGVEQTGYFMWQETGNPDPTMPQETIGRYGREAYDNIGIASAFTVAELLLMNHQTITINNLQCTKPAEHLAAHLIGRIERAEITPEECNKRLTQ